MTSHMKKVSRQNPPPYHASEILPPDNPLDKVAQKLGLKEF